MGLFKHLTPQEEADFRLWARQNYKVYEPIQGIWHPVVQDECVRMNAETGYSPVKVFDFTKWMDERSDLP